MFKEGNAVDKLRFGSNVRLYRKSMGYTQAKLGARVGTSGAYIYELEKGNAEPKVFLAYRIASKLGVTVEQLIGDGA